LASASAPGDKGDKSSNAAPSLAQIRSDLQNIQSTKYVLPRALAGAPGTPPWQALKLLAHLADTRAVDVFLEALAKNSTAVDVVLSAFGRLPDERLRAAFAQWVDAREREGVPPDWRPLVRARALLALPR